MSNEDKAKARCYSERLEKLFMGQDNVMPERNDFFNCVQAENESITKYET